MDCIVHGVEKSWTRLSDFHSHSHIYVQYILYMHYNTLQCLIRYIIMCFIYNVHYNVHTVHQAPLLMEFSRQEYYNGVPFPTPGDFLDPGIESTSLESPSLTDRFFTISATCAVHSTYYNVLSCVYNIYM